MLSFSNLTCFAVNLIEIVTQRVTQNINAYLHVYILYFCYDTFYMIHREPINFWKWKCNRYCIMILMLNTVSYWFKMSLFFFKFSVLSDNFKMEDTYTCYWSHERWQFIFKKTKMIILLQFKDYHFQLTWAETFLIKFCPLSSWLALWSL